MDPKMMIEKTLKDCDLSRRVCLFLPKAKMENILRTTGITLPRNGIQVEIQDHNKSYWVNLKKHGVGYHLGTGWTNIRDARGLQTGDIIKLYWKDTKFIFTM